MNTCIACCANRSRVHTLSLASCISFFSCGTPFYFRSVSRTLPRVLFVVSTLFPIRRVSPSSLARAGGGPSRRALFIQLPYLNVALTRRKIICKNPHKICKSPLMHREIVALYRRAYGIIISLGVAVLSPSITGNEKGCAPLNEIHLTRPPSLFYPLMTSSPSHHERRGKRAMKKKKRNYVSL